MTPRRRARVTAAHRKQPKNQPPVENDRPGDSYSDNWDRKSGDDIVNEAIHALHKRIEQIVRPGKQPKEAEEA
jgi:hypothetical protein